MKPKKALLYCSQYIRRVIHPEKYVTLRTLCEYAGVDCRTLSSVVKKRLNKKVWHICTDRMLITPPNSVWWVNCIQDADLAMQRKALVILTDKQFGNHPCIVVKNPIEVFAKMCLYFRLMQKEIKVTAVTGSIGKSTTSGMLVSVYSAYKKTYYSPGFGNEPFEIGYSVQHIPARYPLMVQEICENIPNATQFSSMMTAPSLAIITAIDKAHFGTFGSVDNIAAEICGVVKGLPANAPVVVDKTEFRWMDLLDGHPPITVSDVDSTADYFAKDIHVTSSGLTFNIVDSSNNTEHHVSLVNIYAHHNVMAALRVFAAARHMGIPYNTITEGLSRYRTTGIRQNIVKADNDILIYADCYNALASSVKAAIKAADTIPIKGQRWAVLGDIEGCGEISSDQHEECMEAIDLSSFGGLVTVGKKMNAATASYQWKRQLEVHPCQSKDEAEKVLKKHIASGDMVLLKSSHGGDLSTIIEHLWPDALQKANEYNKKYRHWKFSSAVR